MADTQITRWMISESIDDKRIEHGPYASGLEAEVFARRIGFPFLLKYDITINEVEHVQDARLIIIELPAIQRREDTIHVKCSTCGAGSSHRRISEAELWSDIHEFENLRHQVKMFLKTGTELHELGVWKKGLPPPTPGQSV